MGDVTGVYKNSAATRVEADTCEKVGLTAQRGDWLGSATWRFHVVGSTWRKELRLGPTKDE